MPLFQHKIRLLASEEGQGGTRSHKFLGSAVELSHGTLQYLQFFFLHSKELPAVRFFDPSGLNVCLFTFAQLPH